MTFTARLKKLSRIGFLWREHSRTGGVINGVPFTWEAGDIYSTSVLTAEQVAAIRDHDCVELIATGIDPPAIPVPTAPVLEPALPIPVAAAHAYPPPPRRGPGRPRNE